MNPNSIKLTSDALFLAVGVSLWYTASRWPRKLLSEMSLMSVSISFPSTGDSLRIRLAESVVQLLFSPGGPDDEAPLIRSAIIVDDVEGSDMSNRLRQLPSSIRVAESEVMVFDEPGPLPLMLVILSSNSWVS